LGIFQLQHLHAVYPGAAGFSLSGIDLEIGEGESVGLLGPNGAGKSTLLRALAGFLPPAQGSLRFEGKDLALLSARARARKIAFLPQSVQFAFPLRVWDIVEMGRHPHQDRFRPLSQQDHKVCERSLELCDALPLRDRPFQELSGGEQQRVLLASALAQTPRVLLLDEPTQALDLAHQGSLLILLRRLQRSEKLTLVCATHDLNLAGVLLDRVVLLKGGKVLAQGTPTKVLTPGRVRSLYGATVEGVRGRAGRRIFFLRSVREGARP